MNLKLPADFKGKDLRKFTVLSDTSIYSLLCVPVEKLLCQQC